MKKLTLISLSLALSVAGYAQNRVKISEELKNFAVKRDLPGTETKNEVNKASSSYPAYYWPPEEEIIGNTYYDLQTNASMQNRICFYDDGTIGAVWTMGFNYPDFDDRGTGYNYFDGNNWGLYPTARLESYRAGWPSYAPFGENGEINVAHIADITEDGLLFSKRENKGIGEWNQFHFYAPQNSYYENLIWPRIATGGVDHSVIHLIAFAVPFPMWPFTDVLYSRSYDGGITWNPHNIIIPGIGWEDYGEFYGDIFDLIANEQSVAILIGNAWKNFILLKSTDGGDTWEKTVIWEHPYPLWQPGNTTDTFYCTDGAHSLAFDQSGMVHVVFGINRAFSNEDGTYWFPGVGGIGYWNENRPTFSNNLNALSPYGDPGSELEEDYNLIGWTQDINNNGTIDILWDDIAIYYLGLSSMPQLVIDDMNEMYMVFSSVTETYDMGTQSYRHLWCRYSPNGDFWGPFYDLTSEVVHTFDECVFPSIASSSDDNIYLVYQTDDQPGLAVKGDEDPYNENSITFMQVLKDDVKVGIKENSLPTFNNFVLQNYPNPLNERTAIHYVLSLDSRVKLKLFNGFGQQVRTLVDSYQPAGSYNVNFERRYLAAGIYYYTLEAMNEKGLQKRTNKMLIAP